MKPARVSCAHCRNSGRKTQFAPVSAYNLHRNEQLSSGFNFFA